MSDYKTTAYLNFNRIYGHQVRSININGVEWYYRSDVYKLLGIKCPKLASREISWKHKTMIGHYTWSKMKLLKIPAIDFDGVLHLLIKYCALTSTTKMIIQQLGLQIEDDRKEITEKLDVTIHGFKEEAEITVGNYNIKLMR